MKQKRQQMLVAQGVMGKVAGGEQTTDSEGEYVDKTQTDEARGGILGSLAKKFT